MHIHIYIHLYNKSNNLCFLLEPHFSKDEDFRMKLGGLVVVASNAGGAWTPIGDITTTMLYIGGQVCRTTDETALCEVAWI